MIGNYIILYYSQSKVVSLFCVCPSVNENGANHKRYTYRGLVILHAQTSWWTPITNQKLRQSELGLKVMYCQLSDIAYGLLVTYRCGFVYIVSVVHLPCIYTLRLVLFVRCLYGEIKNYNVKRLIEVRYSFYVVQKILSEAGYSRVYIFPYKSVHILAIMPPAVNLERLKLWKHLALKRPQHQYKFKLMFVLKS